MLDRRAAALILATLLLAWQLPGCAGEIDGEDPCEGIYCSGHGFCVAQGGVATCQCVNGYMPVEGPDCALEGTDSPCFGVLCSGHGSCIEVAGEAACACETGYQAQGLECVPVDLCAGVSCSGHGSCVVEGAAPTCECEQGYYAEDLQCLEKTDPCDGELCSGHGTCVAVGTQPVCDCDDGYHSVGFTECESDFVDPCEGIDCSGHGTCRDDGSRQPICDCDAGYHLVGRTVCEEDAPDPCEGVDCSGHGTCRDDGAGAPVCDCDAGYHLVGTTVCEEDAPDPCEGVSCSGHGTCEVGAGGGAQCSCEQGYHAEGLSCVPDDPCEGVVCGAFAECVDGDCFCLEGYEGDPYSACTEIDPSAAAIRAELVAIAEAELGMCEGRDERPYMEQQPGYWCYDFVAWVYSQNSERLPPPISLPNLDPDTQPAGWNPKPGDLIKYDIQHYGMVKEISGDGARVYTLEGNVNSCVMGRSTTHASVEYYGLLEQHLGDGG